MRRSRSLSRRAARVAWLGLAILLATGHSGLAAPRDATPLERLPEAQATAPVRDATPIAPVQPERVAAPVPPASRAAASRAPAVAYLPLPVVGRWAETLSLHGGPVLDLFRIALPELPWPSAVYRGPRLTLHLGLLVEGGWTNNVGYDSWDDYKLSSPLLRVVPEARLAGRAAFRSGWRLAWTLAAAVGLQTFFTDLAADQPADRLHLLELRTRAALALRRSARLAARASVELFRLKAYAGGHGGLAVDVVDARLGGVAPLGPWIRLRWEYLLAAYLNERFARTTAHGPFLAATQLLRLEPLARIRPRVLLGLLFEGGRVDLDRGLALIYPPITLDGYFVRAVGVVEGRPRRWVSYRFGLGYGALLQPSGTGDSRRIVPQHASVAHAGLVFRLWKDLHLRLGYWRDFEPLGVAADFLRTNRATPLLQISRLPGTLQYSDVIHLGLDARLWDRLVVRATFGWRGYRSGDYFGLVSASRLSIPISLVVPLWPMDNLLAQLEVDVFVTPWLALGGGYLYQAQVPGRAVPVSPDPNAPLVVFGYLQHRAVGRVTIRF